MRNTLSPAERITRNQCKLKMDNEENSKEDMELFKLIMMENNSDESNKSEWNDFNKKKPRVGSRVEVVRQDGETITGTYEGLLETKDQFVITVWLPRDSHASNYLWDFSYAKYWRYSDYPKLEKW